MKGLALLDVRCKCYDCPYNDLGNGRWCQLSGDDSYGRRQPCKCFVDPDNPESIDNIRLTFGTLVMEGK